MSICSRLFQASFAVLVLAAGPSYALEFPQTRDRGAPARGPALATRGEVCLDPQVQPSLTSILPHNAIATAFGSDTDLPLSLWFYIPETGANSVELTVVDETGNEIYQHSMNLSGTPGTIQMPLPRYQADGVTPVFTSGSLYYWDFALICDPNDREDDVLLGGGIQRVDASSTFIAQLDAVSGDPLAQAELYANAGAWQETVALAASLYSQNPGAWTELLSSVGLGAIATQPIVGQSMPAVRAVPTTTSPSNALETETAASGELNNDLERLLEGINP
ncbi:MAG: DUF928 domain-containing protein [Cyanobacteria bacterium P01_D01_bin.156]